MPKPPKFSYRLLIENVSQLNESRVTFDKKYGIKNTDARRGATYLRKEGRIVAIAVFWHKGNVDKYFPNQARPYLDTGRYLDVHNLKVGMDVYLLETKYDKTSGSQVK